MDGIGLAVRIVLALGAVLLLMWMIARVSRRTLLGRARGDVAVIARASLSKQASVSVVRLVDRALVIGVTDSQVSLLGEMTADEVGALEGTRTAEERTVITLPSATRTGVSLPTARLAGVRPTSGGRMAGSALSPATWRQAIEAVQERTVRR
jgi:flagellar protein FliO/FliZ